MTSSHLGRAALVARALARDPRDVLERTFDRTIDTRAEARAEARDHAQSLPTYEAAPDAVAALHQALGEQRPCDCEDECDAVWTNVRETLTRQGLEFGRGAFAGWDDGDRAFVETIWCAVRHRRPERVVETGVARGVSSRFVLEALELNGSGRLWSIDLPPLLDHQLRAEVGAAVPARLRARWTYITGSSRRRLPRLMSTLGNTIDLFIHDILHSRRNLLFEWQTAAPHLSSGGVLFADDVHRNAGIASFRETQPDWNVTVCNHSDDEDQFAFALRD